MKVIVEFAEVVDVHHFLSKFDASPSQIINTSLKYNKNIELPDERFEKLPDNFDKLGRVDQIEGLEIFLIFPVKGLVSLQ